MKNATTQFDFRRTLTCAALATITSLGMFSLIANIMTPMFAGIRLLTATGSAQEVNADPVGDKVCVKSMLVDGEEGTHRPSLI